MRIDLPGAGLLEDASDPEGAGGLRILVVDDEEMNVLLLDRLLRKAGYRNIRTSTDSRETFRLVEETEPDLILLDLQMPHVTGFDVLQQLAESSPDSGFRPVLVLTANVTPEAKHRALSLGASDFLTKPFDVMEVLLRVRNLLRSRLLNLQLQRQQSLLEERVVERTRDLEQSQFEILRRLAQAAEFRDDDTGQHTYRVGALAGWIARGLGFRADSVSDLTRAAPLHDVGKIGITDSILRKPGKLTPEEFDIMKTHTTIGARLLAGGQSQAVRLAEQIALSHHERWDGRGYPHGVAGEAIPLPARIVALADFFDALSHDRPYRVAWSIDDIMAEIDRGTGSHFDPRVVEAFGRLLDRIDQLGDPVDFD
jgi:putative two-component system response regulator